jgi:hypothetical protein
MVENQDTWGPLEMELEELLTGFYGEQYPGLSLPRRLADFMRAKIEGAKALMDAANAENDTLRGLLAKGQGPCVYCQLPAEEIAKCKSGFPGCGRMDDIMCAINTERENQLEERITELLGQLSRVEVKEE